MVNVTAFYVERLFTIRNRKHGAISDVCDKLLDMQEVTL
jgi:hypothetical protein